MQTSHTCAPARLRSLHGLALPMLQCCFASRPDGLSKCVPCEGEHQSCHLDVRRLAGPSEVAKEAASSGSTHTSPPPSRIMDTTGVPPSSMRDMRRDDAPSASQAASSASPAASRPIALSSSGGGSPACLHYDYRRHAPQSQLPRPSRAADGRLSCNSADSGHERQPVMCTPSAG